MVRVLTKNNMQATKKQVMRLARRDLLAALNHPNCPQELLEKHWLSHYEIVSVHPTIPMLSLTDPHRWCALQIVKQMDDLEDKVRTIGEKAKSNPDRIRILRRLCACLGHLGVVQRKHKVDAGSLAITPEVIRAFYRLVITPEIEKPDELYQGVSPLMSTGLYSLLHLDRITFLLRQGQDYQEFSAYLHQSVVDIERFLDGQVAWVEKAIDKHAKPQVWVPAQKKTKKK